MTATRSRLELVDFLRGYSITTIVLFHLISIMDLPPTLKTIANFGGAGVHVFILCSGFGLYLSHLNKPLAFISFLKKRFSKVYLPYIVIVLVSALIPYMYLGQNKAMAILSHLFIFKMFSEEFIDSFGMQFWFVSMIFQFYLAFPLIILLFEKIAFPKNLYLSFAISICWASLVFVLGKESYRTFNSFFLQYLWEFVLGMQIAKWYNARKGLPLPKYTTLMATFVAGALVTGLFGKFGGVWKLYNDVPSLVGYLSLALIIYKFDISLINRLFIFTNKISYEWYLIHILVFISMFHLKQTFEMSIENISFAIFVLLLSFGTSYLFRIAMSYLYRKLNI